ncbi:MAG: family 16 glycoside hydrolase [Anaerolineae bacterium]
MDWLRRHSFPRRLRTPKLAWTLPALIVAILALVGCAASQTQAEWNVAFDSAEGWVLSSDAVADIEVRDGVMRIHVLEPGQVAWATSEQTWQDLRVRVDAMQVSGPHDNEYGILLRMDDDRSFYAFSVSGDGYVRAARYESGSWMVLGPDWTPSDAVNQGEATNVLEVVARGTSFEFRVNDQVLLQVEDDVLNAGSVGLYAGAFGEGDVVVAFDNLSVVPVE